MVQQEGFCTKADRQVRSEHAAGCVEEEQTGKDAQYRGAHDPHEYAARCAQAAGFRMSEESRVVHGAVMGFLRILCKIMLTEMGLPNRFHLRRRLKQFSRGSHGVGHWLNGRAVDS